MAETEDKLVTCPSCGREGDGSEICCEFARTVRSEPIPVIAEVVTSTGERKPIRTRWMRFGREQDNDIVLDDTYVSRYHAWITFDQDRFWVEDLGSTNGTVLNGDAITRRELLANGDKIKIGESEMTFALLEKTGSST